MQPGRRRSASHARSSNRTACAISSTETRGSCCTRVVRVLATRQLPGEAWNELGDVEVGELEGRRDGVEALIVAGDRVDDAVLDLLPSLRLVASYGVGYDSVDVAACRARGIAVTNTPGVLDAATADLAIALV